MFEQFCFWVFGKSFGNSILIIVPSIQLKLFKTMFYLLSSPDLKIGGFTVINRIEKSEKQDKITESKTPHKRFIQRTYFTNMKISYGRVLERL